jgi:tRNA(fMet)-specific endonuclease VapC
MAAHMLDTSIAIHLRDGEESITRKVRALGEPLLLSIISRVELEGGVYRDPLETGRRRARLDAILTSIPVLAFDDDCASAYGAILQAAGYSRRKMLDRMIAAQTLVHRATLVTCNGDDFRDVPGLALLEW